MEFKSETYKNIFLDMIAVGSSQKLLGTDYQVTIIPIDLILSSLTHGSQIKSRMA